MTQHNGPAEPFPLIVGVTGHRDIQPAARDALRLTILAILEGLGDARQFGSDGVFVLSALAQGADQLVAGIAFELGLRLIAVSPMPLGDYRATLQDDPEAAANFEDYWLRADLRLELPWVRDNETQRDHKLQYEQLGAVLSRYSHLLLALWDGQGAWETLTPQAREDVRGGTSHVLHLRANAEREAEGFRRSTLFADADSRLDLAPGGPMLHIVTPRRKTGGVVAGPRGMHVQAGDCIEPGSANRAAKRLESAAIRNLVCAFGEASRLELTRILELNAAIRAFDARDQALHDDHVGYLCPREAADLDGEEVELLHVLRRQQAGADVAAQDYQRRLLGEWSPAGTAADIAGNLWRKAWARGWRHPRRPRLGALFVFAVLGPIAVALFGAYAHLPLEGWTRMAALLLYLAVLAGGLLFYLLRVEHGKWQDRFQDYRALAEAMRVQVFWALAAAPRAVSDHYLRLQRDELGWIQYALRGPALWAAALALHLPRPERRVINECWIENQRDYFLGRPGKPGKAEQNRKAHRELELASKQWFVLGAVLSLALLLVELACILTEGRQRHVPDLELPRDILLFLIPTALTIAASFVVYGRSRGYEAQAQSYQTMGRLFAHAKVQAEADTVDDEAYGRLMFDLGREALAENAAWLLDHRRRPIEHEMH
jgi:hypothetical protein